MSTPEPNTEPLANEDETDAPGASPGQTRRSISEWAVVLALAALIAAVAWSQFGALFNASTQGTEPPSPTENNDP
jgi:hypothetical protein